MASFHYQAVDATGQPVTGMLEADSVNEAGALLEARGLVAHSITRTTSETARSSEYAADATAHAVDQSRAHAQARSPQNIEEAVLRSHMATVLERGRAIAPALRAYAAEMPVGRQRRELLAVCRILERGNQDLAAKALADLPESWIPLLSAATTSPDPGQVLHDFLSESRRTDALYQQRWLTFAYPVVLLCLATAVTTALAKFVIPEFREIFDEFQLELPRFTQWILAFASFLSHWGLLIIVLLFVLFGIVLLNASRLFPTSAFNWLTNRLHLPFGRRTSIARFARFTADLLEAGVKTPDALRIAGFTVNRPRMQRAVWKLANDVDSTGGFSPRAYERPLTASIAHALAADLPTNSRIQLLREISNCHAERTRINLSWASGIVEPIAIFVVGLVVGATVIALFLPLVKLVEGLSG